MEDEYDIDKYVAGGVSGKVFKGHCKSDGKTVAIKSINLKYTRKELYKRLYREICILKHLDSDFTLSLWDIYGKYENEQLIEVCLIMPYMDYDLKTVIQDFRLMYKQIVQISYQLFMGLNYLYESGIIHRDLKPGNIGINKDMKLRILDFGLARDKQDDLTEYVVTRWYRPLEVFCTSQYTMAVDMWSAGCIIVELFTNIVLFRGKSPTDQCLCILKVMGWPSAEMLDKMNNKNSVLGLELYKDFATKSNQLLKLIESPIRNMVPDSAEGEDCFNHAIGLISKILELDPDKRITPREALNSELFTRDTSYTSSYTESGNAREFKIDSFSDSEDVGIWKEEILLEIENFLPINGL